MPSKSEASNGHEGHRNHTLGTLIIDPSLIRRPGRGLIRRPGPNKTTGGSLRSQHIYIFVVFVVFTMLLASLSEANWLPNRGAGGAGALIGRTGGHNKTTGGE